MTGRPSSYSIELATEICDLVSTGWNINHLCEDEGFPSQSTIYRWFDDYPEFWENYERARARRADTRSDRIDDICRKVLLKEITPDIATVVINAEKWQSGKEQPKRYGDRITQDVDAKVEVADVSAAKSKLLGGIIPLPTPSGTDQEN